MMIDALQNLQANAELHVPGTNSTTAVHCDLVQSYIQYRSSAMPLGFQRTERHPASDSKSENPELQAISLMGIGEFTEC